MELHALYVHLTVPQTHDRLSAALLIFGPRSDFKTIWQRLGIHNQTVVTGRGQRAGEIGEDALADVMNRTGLTVHHLGGAHNLATKDCTDTLLT